MRKLARNLVAAAVFVVAPLSIIACGPPTPTAKTAKVTPGVMPAGASFKGVWFNPVFGELHMLQEGSNVTGKYKSEQQGVWGKITGTVDGDVVHFEWEEHKTGAIGPGSTRKGKGYWKYTPQDPPAEPQIKGEWGFGDNEVGGGDWDSIRQKDIPPKPDTIGGEADPSVDTGWDAPAKK